MNRSWKRACVCAGPQTGTRGPPGAREERRSPKGPKATSGSLADPLPRAQTMVDTDGETHLQRILIRLGVSRDLASRLLEDFRCRRRSRPGFKHLDASR